MPDLFDTVAELPTSPKADVFDHLAPDNPAGDLFDQVAAAPSPNALRLQAVATGAEPPRDALEQDIQNLHGRSRGPGMGFREAPGTSKTRSLYDLATAPLATLANGVTAQMVNDARDVLMANSEVNQLAAVAKAQGFPLSTAQVQQLYEARIARPQQKPEKIDQAVAGVQNVAANAVNSLISPPWGRAPCRVSWAKPSQGRSWPTWRGIPPKRRAQRGRRASMATCNRRSKPMAT
jgi:phage FluMu protein gp41